MISRHHSSRHLALAKHSPLDLGYGIQQYVKAATHTLAFASRLVGARGLVVI